VSRDGSRDGARNGQVETLIVPATTSSGRERWAVGPEAVVLDLDGTLVDTVYQHVVAWQEAFDAIGVALPAWRVHRRIGMSGAAFVDELTRDAGVVVDETVLRRLSAAHDAALHRTGGAMAPHRGARQLLGELTRLGVPWAITTSGTLRLACPALDVLGVPDAVLVCGDEVRRAPRAPRPLDLVVIAAARLRVPPSACAVVGDSVWDLLAAGRAGAVGIGVLSGGYGRDELERAGAARVFEDAGALLEHLGEVRIGATT